MDMGILRLVTWSPGHLATFFETSQHSRVIGFFGFEILDLRFLGSGAGRLSSVESDYLNEGLRAIEH